MLPKTPFKTIKQNPSKESKSSTALHYSRALYCYCFNKDTLGNVDFGTNQELQNTEKVERTAKVPHALKHQKKPFCDYQIRNFEEFLEVPRFLLIRAA